MLPTMILATVTLAFVALGPLALRWGTDSRDGRDWTSPADRRDPTRRRSSSRPGGIRATERLDPTRPGVQPGFQTRMLASYTRHGGIG